MLGRKEGQESKEHEPREREEEKDMKRRELAHRRFLLTTKGEFEGEGKERVGQDRLEIRFAWHKHMKGKNKQAF